jgi:hypothetical protein
MKRKLLFAAGFVVITISFNSCEGLFGNCKICRENTYNTATGTLLTEGEGSEYCDEKLLAIESIRDASIGGITTSWVCK